MWRTPSGERKLLLCVRHSGSKIRTASFSTCRPKTPFKASAESVANGYRLDWQAPDAGGSDFLPDADALGGLHRPNFFVYSRYLVLLSGQPRSSNRRTSTVVGCSSNDDKRARGAKYVRICRNQQARSD